MITIAKHILALTVAAFAGSLFAAERAPPNLVVIMADDQGNADVGFNGGQDIPKPNLDRLSAGGEAGDTSEAGRRISVSQEDRDISWDE